MNERDAQRVIDLLLEIGGRSPWVLLWEEEPGDDAQVMSSVPPEEVAGMVCGHLLRMLKTGFADDAVTMVREQ